MANQEVICKQEPLGKKLTGISKLYYGVVTQRLHKVGGIERYYYALIIIHKHQGKITQKALSEIMGTDKVFTVKILDYLSSKKLIRRVVNAEDRREHHVELTAKGEKIIPEIAKTFNDVNELVMKGVKNDHQDIFFQVLESIQQNLEKLPADKVTIKFSNKSK